MKLFGEQFKIGIHELIRREIEKKQKSMNESTFFQEILEHAKHCVDLTKNMNYNNQYSDIEKYILDEKNNSPLVLVGASGAGKR